jgi:hypothetical protein
MVMKVLVMMMMIPMKPSSMTVTMAMISLLWEGIPLADLCLPESFLSLGVFSAPQRRRSIYAIPFPVLGFWEEDICKGALAEVGQGDHTTWRGSQGWHVLPIFCCFCVSEKLHRKYSRNWTKRSPKFLDMGWPDLLVSDTMVMMAADDCRG